jgi:hypothetical protein
MKNTKKSGWNTLARHAENIPSEQRFIPYLAELALGALGVQIVAASPGSLHYKARLDAR